MRVGEECIIAVCLVDNHLCGVHGKKGVNDKGILWVSKDSECQARIGMMLGG